VLAHAKENADVVIDYVSDEGATEELEQKVRDLGDQVTAVDADVSKVEDLRTLIDTAVRKFGRLDVMVNNAGIETRTSILDTSEERYEKVLDINLKSAFFGTSSPTAA
jgi:glucose 1-dehydrogenase